MIDNDFRLALDILYILVKSKNEYRGIDFSEQFFVEVWDFDIKALMQSNVFKFGPGNFIWFYRETHIDYNLIENLDEKELHRFLNNKRNLYHYFNKYFEEFEKQYQLWEIINVVFDIENKVIKLQRRINDRKNPSSKKAITVTLSSEIIGYILETFKLQNV